MLTENSTISHISDKLGFSNSASYTKMFKSYIGITPNDYRSLNIKDKYLLMNYEVLSEDNEQHLKQYSDNRLIIIKKILNVKYL